MHGHELHLVGLLAVVGIGIESDVLQIGVKGESLPLDVLRFVHSDGVHELRDVLQPLFVVVVAVLFLESGDIEYMLEQSADTAVINV